MNQGEDSRRAVARQDFMEIAYAVPLDSVLMRMWRRERDSEYPSPDMLADDLADAEAELSVLDRKLWFWDRLTPYLGILTIVSAFIVFILLLRGGMFAKSEIFVLVTILAGAVAVYGLRRHLYYQRQVAFCSVKIHSIEDMALRLTSWLKEKARILGIELKRAVNIVDMAELEREADAALISCFKAAVRQDNEVRALIKESEGNADSLKIVKAVNPAVDSKSAAINTLKVLKDLGLVKSSATFGSYWQSASDQLKNEAVLLVAPADAV
jgi:phage terminase small subunit